LRVLSCLPPDEGARYAYFGVLRRLPRVRSD
jgi:hypothetical protein